MTINYSFVLADLISRLNPFSGETSIRLNTFRQDTSSNPKLSALLEIVYHGRSEKQKQVPVHLKNYWAYRNELSIENGLILKGERVITQKSQRLLFFLENTPGPLRRRKMPASSKIMCILACY